MTEQPPQETPEQPADGEPESPPEPAPQPEPQPEPEPTPEPEAEPEPEPEPAQPTPRRRSRGLVLLGLLLASTGVVWLLSSTGVLDVSPLVWLGALLVLVGAALVIVPRGGHVGVLIALGIILSLTGAAASTIDTHLLSGGAGDRTVRPQSIGDLQHYKLGAGSLQIDLTAFAGDLEPVPVKATLGVGEIVVTVPADAALDVTSHVSVGEIVIRGERRSGVDVDFNARFQGSLGPVLVLDLKGGMGSIRVEDGNGP